MTESGPSLRRVLPAPSGVSQLPYLLRILRDPAPVLDELSARYGSVFALGVPSTRFAILGDPKVLDDVWSQPVEAFRWGHRLNVLGFVVGEGSMIVSDGVEHRRRRGAVVGAFSRRRLNRWVPLIFDAADRTIDELEASLPAATQPIDLMPIMRTLVLRIVVHALFGPRLAERADEIGAHFDGPQRYLESPAFKQIPHPIPHTARARVRADRLALDRIIDEQIAHVRAHPSDDPGDILEPLVQSGELSDAEIRDQVVTLIGAGFDSTTATLSWTLWHAGLEPGVWSRLRDEADAVLGPVDGETTLDHVHLAQLAYSSRVMRETLRLHPAGLLSPRQAARDLVVGDYVVKRGTFILWSPYLAGRDPASWPDPLRFDPDRFLDPSAGQQAVIDRAWIPFGRGARQCIGFALAQMELTAIVARLAQRLDLRLDGSRVPRPVGMVVNRPEGGVPATLEPRYIVTR